MATHSSILVWKIPWAGAQQAAVNEVTESDMTERQLSYFNFHLLFFSHHFLSLHAYFCIFSSNYTTSSLLLFSTVSHLPLNPSTKFLILVIIFSQFQNFHFKTSFYFPNENFNLVFDFVSMVISRLCRIIPRVAVILFLLSNSYPKFIHVILPFPCLFTFYCAQLLYLQS